MSSSVKLLKILLLWVVCQPADAVQISQGRIGEVLIFPYYTVNNGLNTLYSVVNTSDQPIAAKIRFLEGQNAADVLTFNIYLSAHDVWTGALVPAQSTIAGHQGEDSVMHFTSDQSCAPFLLKNGQEFLPFLIDLDGSNDDLVRARDGHFEVLEMGVVTGEAANHVTHDSDGIPQACEMILAAWGLSGEWLLSELGDPVGGLTGSASLVNVSEGLSFSYDPLVLSDFWQQSGIHTEPGSELPNLSSAAPESRVFLDDGEWALSQWTHGYQAVSAVMMQQTIINEYALDSLVNGKSEWVVTMPTKHHHTNQVPLSQIPPFTSPWTGRVACGDFEITTFDREEQLEILTVGGVTRPPRPPAPQFCFASNLLEFILPGNDASIRSGILGSTNRVIEKTPSSATTENGWAVIAFSDARNQLESQQGPSYKGLPVTGFAVQQFTNGGAGPGLLAQYGSLFEHKGTVKTF